MHNSKKKVPEEFIESMYKVMFDIVGKRNNLDEFKLVIGSVFSRAEQMAVLKRVTIWLLLRKGIDYETTAQALHVSISSVSKYAIILSIDRYINKIISDYAKKEKLFDTLSELFERNFGAPGMYGVGWEMAWKRIFERQRKKAVGL